MIFHEATSEHSRFMIWVFSCQPNGDGLVHSCLQPDMFSHRRRCSASLLALVVVLVLVLLHTRTSTSTSTTPSISSSRSSSSISRAPLVHGLVLWDVCCFFCLNVTFVVCICSSKLMAGRALQIRAERRAIFWRFTLISRNARPMGAIPEEYIEACVEWLWYMLRMFLSSYAA